jgi:hypothetical protein
MYLVVVVSVTCECAVADKTSSTIADLSDLFMKWTLDSVVMLGSGIPAVCWPEMLIWLERETPHRPIGFESLTKQRISVHSLYCCISSTGRVLRLAAEFRVKLNMARTCNRPWRPIGL